MLAKEISSLQHPIVKKCVKLRTSKKARYENRQLLLTGSKLIEEAKSVDLLFTINWDPISCQAAERYLVTKEVLKKITGQMGPEPYAALVPMPNFHNLHGKKRLLALDKVTDPGNVGSLIRTAFGLGFEGIFLVEGCADPFNEKVLRSAMGAALRFPIQQGSLSELLYLAADYTPLIADMGGTCIAEVQKPKSPLLILGSESHGVSEELKGTFPHISIPIQGVESLNVSAAGAIILYHLVHER
jgi:TrmH family RNA methyltransferase